MRVTVVGWEILAVAARLPGLYRAVNELTEVQEKDKCLRRKGQYLLLMTN